jgi:hypothetical protein
LKKNPTAYSQDFEQNFWRPYPRTLTMSKKKAFQEWSKLSADQRLAACHALPAYLKYLKQKPDLGVVHAERFLSQNRAEVILELSAEKPVFDISRHLV